MRNIDYNGHCPDDDGDSTAAESELVMWVEEYLRFCSISPTVVALNQQYLTTRRRLERGET